jgi:hypothetical protein
LVECIHDEGFQTMVISPLEYSFFISLPMVV